MQKMPRIVVTLTLASLLAFGAVAAFAETPETAASTEAKVENAVPETVEVTFAGMQIAVDPETGRLRQPTALEAQKLAVGMRKMFGERGHAKSEVVDHGDGMMSAVVAPNYLRYSILRVNPDGSLSQECVESPEGARQFVEAATAHNSSDEQ